MHLQNKPKLIFFRWTTPHAPSYVSQHLQHQLLTLSHFFDVTLIDSACDYAEVCDKYEPDVCLFESGVYISEHRITNITSRLDIPRLGLCNADANCVTRAVFLSDMERWHIDTFFTISVAMPSYTSEIADNLYVWPHSVDTSVYRDYKEAKHIPVLFTGSQAPHYPWRRRLYDVLSRRYPSMLCPHFGWFGTSATAHMLYGEQYARLVNAAMFVPACGSIARDFVRKYLEVPACGACLISEPSHALEAAGFIDMHNCVLADESTVIDKLDFLFRHPDRLQQITDAGRRLVHDRHTIMQRGQLLQWLLLRRHLGSNEQIIQTGPFEALTVNSSLPPVSNTQLAGDGLDLSLLLAGNRHFDRGDLASAERAYLSALSYGHFFPNVTLRIALCKLRTGKPADALGWLWKSIEKNLDVHSQVTPDPVEWAYVVIAHLCLGRVERARDLLSKFPSLRHAELDRVRAVVSFLCHRSLGSDKSDAEATAPRLSVHSMPQRSFSEWLRELRLMLAACGQAAIASQVAAIGSSIPQPVHSPPRAKSINVSRSLPKRQAAGRARRSLLATLWIRALRAIGQRLERKFGYFLPYKFSSLRSHGGYREIERLMASHEVRRVLLIGPARSAPCTESVLQGRSESASHSTVLCYAASSRSFDDLMKQHRGDTYIKFLPPEPLSLETIGDLDMLVMDAAYAPEISLSVDQLNVEFVVLDGIATLPENYSNYHRLLADSRYRLITHDIDMGRSVAVFRRTYEQRAARHSGANGSRLLGTELKNRNPEIEAKVVIGRRRSVS